MAFPYHLLKCFSCGNASNNKAKYSRHKIYHCLHEIHCYKCNSNWLACASHNQRWSRRRFFQATEHVKKKHHVISDSDFNRYNHIIANNETCFLVNSDSENNSEDMDNISHDISSSNSDDIVQNDEIIKSFIASHKVMCLEGYNIKFRRFIETELVSAGDGIKRIVACALAMDFASEYRSIPMKDTLFHLKATLFCCTLSSSQQKMYSELCGMMKYSSLDGDNNFGKMLSLNAPSSSMEIDRYYMKRTTSIANNIPIPSILEVDDHAYVSFRSVLQHFLYFVTSIDGMLIENTTTDYKDIISLTSPLNNSEISNIIRNNVKSTAQSTNVSPLIIKIIVWSDDFEPNHVKQHKKSTWIKTVTISPPNGNQTSIDYTYVIALGAKEKNHEVVNHKFFQELKEFEVPQYLFCKATSCNIPVVAQILAISADRPERSALNSALGHNGITTRRWRYAAYIDPDSLKSCVRCYRKRIQYLCNGIGSSNRRCIECCDWNYNHSLLESSVPLNYPKKQHLESPSPPEGREVIDIQILKPIEMSYELMKQGVKFCFFNCYHGEWKQVEALVYLKSIGVNEKFGLHHVFNVARRLRKNPNYSNSNVYSQLSFPSHWTSGLTLDQCIDTPMHHLFQGIVKSIMDLTIDWLTGKQGAQYKDFGDVTHKTMLSIHNLNLDWCRMETFMGGRKYSLGGWQAENYVAFARCMLIIYACIRDIVSDGELGIDEHECMIQSLLRFITSVMSKQNIEIDDISNNIKCFLSACDNFEYTAYIIDENRPNPIWFTKGNFLSLLNLPAQIEKFGNLRFYWEGSRERSIQQIKPFLVNMRSTSSYFKTKLTHMYVSQTLKSVESKFIDKEEDNKVKRYYSFKTYSAIDNIHEIIEQKHCISAVYMKYNSESDSIFICQRNSPRHCLIFKVSFKDNDGFNKCGLWYAPIEISVANIGNEITQKDIQSRCVDYVLLCPCISADDSLNECYTVIFKSWRYRYVSGIESVPELSKNMFLSTLN